MYPCFEAVWVLDFSVTYTVRTRYMFCLCTQVNTGNSILSELTKAEMSKKVGHFGFSICYTHVNGTWMAVF